MEKNGVDLCVECISTSQLVIQKGIRSRCASEQWKMRKSSNTDDINNNDPCLQKENNQVRHNNTVNNKNNEEITVESQVAVISTQQTQIQTTSTSNQEDENTLKSTLSILSSNVGNFVSSQHGPPQVVQFILNPVYGPQKWFFFFIFHTIHCTNNHRPYTKKK